MNCEIILIGNELLIGKIQDTNSKWIIDQLLLYGIETTRITTIKDNIDIIASTIHESLSRSPNYLFTSGGLGPTHDDMTLKGVSKGLDPEVELDINDEALEMVKNRYQRLYPSEDVVKLITPSREKMAILPKGAIPLVNNEGSAPGVLIPEQMTNGKSKIICLPGIPRELQAIFSDNFVPEIKNIVSEAHFNECGFIFSKIGESDFTEKVNSIISDEKYSEIWIKTHPKKKKDKIVELHLTSFSKNPKIVNLMIELYSLLQKQVLINNGKIISENPHKSTIS